MRTLTQNICFIVSGQFGYGVKIMLLMFLLVDLKEKLDRWLDQWWEVDIDLEQKE